MTRPRMKHNPAFLAPEDLVRTFVVRHADLELVLERLREAAPNASPHMLLIAPRGSGKTTLVLRAVAAVRSDPALASRFHPIVFGEESYEVSTAAEFWLEAVFHLGVQTKEARFSEAYKQMKAERDEERLSAKALGVLLDFADEQKKRLVFVVENLNMILGEQVTEKDGWKLRHTLTNEPRIVLLATATSRFEEIDNQDKALYDLFWTHQLEPLDTEACRTLWAAITGERLEGDRIRPVEILTGGNPRLLAILAGFAAKMSLGELMRDLAQLVDDHTTYFKSNLELLAPAERRVYVALADIWSPATAREVAEAARTDVNKASAMLHRLVGRGAVTEVDRRGKQVRYQLAERMYNIYHLMRRTGGDESRVRAVVDFMVHLYDREELVRVAGAIAEEARACEPGARTDHFHVYAALAKSVEEELRERMLASTPEDFFALEDAPPAIRELLRPSNGSSAGSFGGFAASEQSLRRALEDQPEDAALWLQFACVLVQKSQPDEAEKAAMRSVELSPSREAWVVLGAVALDHGRPTDAETRLRHALDLQPNDPVANAFLGRALQHLNRLDEAAAALQQAHAALPNNSHVASWLADVHRDRSAYSEAEEAYRAVIKSAPSYAPAWLGLGRTLLNMKRMQEAEEAVRQFVRLDPQNRDGLAWLALVLAEQNRSSEAVEAATQSLSLGPTVAGWVSLACAQVQLGNAVEAETSARNLICLDADPAFTNLFRSILDVRLQRRSDANQLAGEYLALTKSRGLCLDLLTLAVLTKGWTKLYPQAKSWMTTSVADEPDSTHHRLTLARVLAALRAWPEALAELGHVLADASLVDAEMSTLIDLLVAATAALGPAPVRATLQASPRPERFEPLLVALAILSGKDPNVPQEVREIANDILRRIEAARAPSAHATVARRSNGSTEHDQPVAAAKASRTTKATPQASQRAKRTRTSSAKEKRS